MKSIICASLMILLFSGSSALALPGDSTEGKELHEANCTGCHDTGVYTRKDRKVQSLDALQQQMSNCGHAVGRTFTETETQNLVKYLNETFYKFQ